MLRYLGGLQPARPTKQSTMNGLFMSHLLVARRSYPTIKTGKVSWPVLFTTYLFSKPTQVFLPCKRNHTRAMSLITTRPHEVADATLKYLSSLSIVLTDWEIRFSCIKNESDFWPAICQLHLLSKLQRIKIQFEFIASSYLYKKEDRLVAQETCLFKEQMETMNQLWHICNRRMTGIDEAMAECGFGNSIPCRKLFKQLPPYYSQVPADIHLQEVAQGRSVYEWADHKRHQYEKDPAFQNKSRGVLERQIWDDLPPELKEWVPKPKEEPLGFQLSWHDTMSNTEFQEKLLSCLVGKPTATK